MRPLRLSARTLCSALGCGMAAHRDALLEERSGLRPIDMEGVDLDTWVGRVEGVEDVELPASFQEYVCRNSQLALMALETDGFLTLARRASARYGAHRIGLFLGTSTSGIREAEVAYLEREKATDALRDFRYNTTQSIFSVGDFVRRILGLSGPATVVSTACSSSAKVFAIAENYISAGFCDAAIVGGVDSLCLTTLYGFNSLQLVSKQPCRPFDCERDGLTIGEAAGFALLEREHVAEDVSLLGYGESSDAWHMSQPEPNGAGAARAMRSALETAKLSASDIHYINLHGTATLANDRAEDCAVVDAFGQAVPCSSTKGFTGHALGAAGIVEALIASLAIENDTAFKNINAARIDSAIRSRILLETVSIPITGVMTNSFGFGGNNVSLILGRAP